MVKMIGWFCFLGSLGIAVLKMFMPLPSFLLALDIKFGMIIGLLLVIVSKVQRRY